MTCHFVCPHCKSGIHVHPDSNAQWIKCDICHKESSITFNQEHESGQLKKCPLCHKNHFYKQKDFNRIIGISLFLLASVLAIFTYGLSFIGLYLIDFFLFRKLQMIAICYDCSSVFRQVANIEEIPSFDHETHDRLRFADIKT